MKQFKAEPVRAPTAEKSATPERSPTAASAWEATEDGGIPNSWLLAQLGHSGRVASATLAREPSDGSGGAGVQGDRTVDPRVEATIDARQGAGTPLPPVLGADLATTLGDQLSDVRVHTDPEASSLARSVAARAFTVGSDIFFGAGEYRPGTQDGDQLIAHEAVHTIQQRGAPTSGPLKVTEPGDSLEREADRASRAPSPAIKSRTDARQVQPAPDTPNRSLSASPRKLARYEPGEHIQFETRGQMVTIDGFTFDERYLVAMGDFYKDPDALRKAKKDELKELISLIDQDERMRTGKPREGDKALKEEDWTEWSKKSGHKEGEQYMDLNKKNEAHFADLNMQRWAELHVQALKQAQHAANGSGSVSAEAVITNGFAKHFLTDAFSAGHLVNKSVVKAAAKPSVKAGDNMYKLAFAIAEAILHNQTALGMLDGMEIADGAIPVGQTWGPPTKERLASLLASAMYWKTDDFLSIFVRLAHDDLNEAASHGKGVPVANAFETWRLPGDTTLAFDKTKTTLKYGQLAVKASNDNLAAAAHIKSPAAYHIFTDAIPKTTIEAMLQNVRQYVPHRTPDETGRDQVAEASSKYTDATNKTTIEGTVKLSLENMATAVDELKKNHLVQPAGKDAHDRELQRLNPVRGMKI